MLSEESLKQPKLLRDYLNFNINLNKSPNSIKEYNYDLTRFLKFMMATSKGIKRSKLDYEDIDISSIESKFLSRIDSGDIYEYMSYLATDLK